ncbi:MAG: hypothetical protein ACRDPF_19060, partial [Streptosporangiaceae bacterium]
GTQAQKVIFVALEFLHEAPASSVAPPLAAGAALFELVAELLPPLLPHAASSETAATAASPAAARPAVRPGGRGQLCLEGKGIFAKLLM